MTEHCSSPSTSSEMPAYVLWARNVENVLNDHEGHKLFLSYLRAECAANTSDFYYVVRTLRAEPERVKQELVEKVAKRFFRHSSPSCLLYISSTMREAIEREVKSCRGKKAADIAVFAEAVNLTMEQLRRHHCAFVQSEAYIAAVQRLQAGLDAVAEGEEDGNRPLGDNPYSPHPLSTVSEETSGFKISTKLNDDLDDDDDERPRILNESDEPRSEDSPTHQAQADMSRLTLTPAALEASIKHRSATLPKRPPVARAALPPNPYHTNYVPMLPPSMRDSAVSSSAISSEATNDSNHNRHAMRTSVQRSRHTREEHLRVNIETHKTMVIPRTQWANDNEYKKQRHGSPEYRERFAQELCDKLNELCNQRDANIKLDTCLQNISSDPRSIKEIIHKYAEHRRGKHSTARGGERARCDNDILDAHVSQQWATVDSSKHSPSASRASTQPRHGFGEGSFMPSSMISMQAGASFVPQLKQHSPQRQQRSSNQRTPSTQHLSNQRTPSTQHHGQSASGNSSTIPRHTGVSKTGFTKCAAPPSDTSGIDTGSSTASYASTMPHNFAKTPTSSRSQPPARPPLPMSIEAQEMVVVQYTLPYDDNVPFQSKINSPCTLRQFKSSLPKRSSSYRYYFKCVDEGGLEIKREISMDSELLPLYNGRILATVQSVDLHSTSR